MRKLLELLKLLNAPCRDMTALISKAQDIQLPFRERFAYKLHIIYCTSCRRYRQQVRILHQAFQALLRRLESAPIDPQAGLSPEARARIARNLSKQ